MFTEFASISAYSDAYCFPIIWNSNSGSIKVYFMCISCCERKKSAMKAFKMPLYVECVITALRPGCSRTGTAMLHATHPFIPWKPFCQALSCTHVWLQVWYMCKSMKEVRTWWEVMLCRASQLSPLSWEYISPINPFSQERALQDLLLNQLYCL